MYAYIYAYIMEYYSAMKKNKLMAFAATQMDHHTEVTQTKTNIILHHFYVESKKSVQMCLYT